MRRKGEGEEEPRGEGHDAIGREGLLDRAVAEVDGFGGEDADGADGGPADGRLQPGGTASRWNHSSVP